MATSLQDVYRAERSGDVDGRPWFAFGDLITGLSGLLDAALAHFYGAKPER